MPIGRGAALAALRVLAETPRRAGRFDLPGAITGTGGVAALVYGLSNAATGPNGVSHWGDAKVVAALAAAVVLLAAFAVIEARSRHALLPVHLLRDRNRTRTYLIMLCAGTAGVRAQARGAAQLCAWPAAHRWGRGSLQLDCRSHSDLALEWRVFHLWRGRDGWRIAVREARRASGGGRVRAWHEARVGSVWHGAYGGGLALSTGGG